MRVLFVGAAIIAAGLGVASPANAQTPAAKPAAVDTKATVDKYCVNCHNDRRKVGNLSLQSVDMTDVKSNAPLLAKVVKKLRGGVMPPVGAARPEPAAYLAFRQTIEQTLDDAARREPNPGRTEGLHRLNRVEYANAVRDLLHLEGVNYSTLLPGEAKASSSAGSSRVLSSIRRSANSASRSAAPALG